MSPGLCQIVAIVVQELQPGRAEVVYLDELGRPVAEVVVRRPDHWALDAACRIPVPALESERLRPFAERLLGYRETPGRMHEDLDRQRRRVSG
ncbi:MAG: hypothetical protein IT458_18735 [Planctomycetes bacterium]|nr:hypothetical protein [Planctomycetota bacterium]